jgi:hypothetical protein
LVGDVAQCDLWFPPRKILLEDGSRMLLPVLVLTCAHSRFMLGRMIPTRKTPDLLMGSWELLRQLGRVPRRLIWDNESGIGRGKLTEPAAVFAGTLATKIVLLAPKDPESKEWSSDALGSSRPPSCPGVNSPPPADFNAQFSEWLTSANTRAVRTIKTSRTRVRRSAYGQTQPGSGRWMCTLGAPRTDGSAWAQLIRAFGRNGSRFYRLGRGT